MKILITGASGFVGTHLVEHFKKNYRKTDLHCTTLGGPANLSDLLPQNRLYEVDLMNPDKTEDLIKLVEPDAVIHLAALASVAKSFENPQLVLKNNLILSVNLLESLRKHAKNSTVLLIGSADEYGLIEPNEVPIDEDVPLRPASPYAVSKVAIDYLGYQYFQAYKLKVIRLRPFNHIGEYQALGFVVTDFAHQIAQAETDPGKIIKVGNLSAVRDFTDVKDMVHAYSLALQKCKPGEVYNVGSGKGVRIQDLLNLMLGKANREIRVEVDPKLYRPIDEESIIANPKKFQQTTGWKATIPLEATLGRVLNYFRNKIRREA